ncbi:uncharacterized protein PGTG_21066 [Puccinia graminis f. sp. tritici CRL 75-36-700-3]|uniref:Uncharacterized protein n=1 Tax=Puccinia graminis f. sp. tritici (strain CRL 75-36-700-3 / race SCCL) TaxID=418459 RepID=H6QQA7_PUCGT|nr:uncharacterized protein PGTG_21066 [Puccinia graminis f. sp. tritici CRL 75-36-700-3]EHS64808.1 hypothetical protein PGTG_21066 [Puccinia graminis f. sp. tritici CRL 75-36-700-3]
MRWLGTALVVTTRFQLGFRPGHRLPGSTRPVPACIVEPMRPAAGEAPNSKADQLSNAIDRMAPELAEAQHLKTKRTDV